MIDNNPDTNTKKETTRLHLLANMLCVANTSQLTTSHNRWSNFWQGLLKKSRVL